MKEKEWKKEQKIPLLPVELPEDSVMQKECRAIVEKAIPKRQSLWKESNKFTGVLGNFGCSYFIRAEVSGLLLPCCIWESDGSDSCMPSSPKRRG